MRSNCNGQGACILVIKVKENGTIIGGYNPYGWSYYDDNYYDYHGYNGELYYDDYDRAYYWNNTADSFIFSLDNGKDLKKFKISRVTNENYALCETNYSLDFGNGDLIINGTNGTCNQSYYESNILDTNGFSIEEMEIFSFYQS
ncbi:hypothetical protein RhiirA1_394786 [Rhizophagus irregularis]|uniref:TLDc domain-containing protein n=1 Tax=Rhizophagus irregularis TaxID=588596 RepID=A0A2N0RRX8_9GLOM|nr:hypothetical protein RhiirA1_394786 [Rhizophagus irregularis]CAB4479686.1 unnamed protein product [Rhizophagus irregularis]